MRSINPDKNRRSVRLKNYDYRSAGFYYVTVCTAGRQCILGEVRNSVVELSEFGQMVQECWLAIPDHNPGITLDHWVVMPNHVHGIVVIPPNEPNQYMVGARHASPLHGQFGAPPSMSLGTLIGSFKSASAKQINAARKAPGCSIWQRGYYERIVRNEKELQRVR